MAQRLKTSQEPHFTRPKIYTPVIRFAQLSNIFLQFFSNASKLFGDTLNLLGRLGRGFGMDGWARINRKMLVLRFENPIR